METGLPAAASLRKKSRVLIVDDNPGDMTLTTRHLGAAWPFEHELLVDWAEDGVQALDKLGREEFALLILDWQMPRMGGNDVLRHVRTSGARIPVVVLSGLRRGDINENLEAQRAAFLNKDEMNGDTFQRAIQQSLHLLGPRPTAS